MESNWFRKLREDAKNPNKRVTWERIKKLIGKYNELEQENRELREENERLKGR